MIIALGYYPGDQELAKKLSGWIKELGPNRGHSVLLARDVRCTGDESIKYNLEAVFDKVEIINVVEKIDSNWSVDNKSALSANIVFRTVAKHVMYTSQEPFLWIESDVVPLREGWVEIIAKEYAEKKKPFLGDFVNVPGVIPHMSGIAVYENRITDHAGHAVMADEIAFDVFAADQIVPHMAQTARIAHRWKFPKLNNQSELDNLLGQLGDAVLFHQDKSGSIIDLLRQRRHPAPAPQNPVQVNLERSVGTCDIFIKTYPQDYPWLEWCLKSVDRFASEFRSLLIVCPKPPPPRDFFVRPNATIKFSYIPKEEYGNDNYLSQQVFKLYADTFTDADHILHTDSDTIFTIPVTPETYLKNGKFVWMMTPIGDAHPNEASAWKKVMHKFLGKEPEFEFMRRHPFLLPRWLYGELRAFCVRTHGVELKDYVMAQPYREFSEFNVLGFYAYEYHRDKFEWFDTSKHPESEWPVLTVDQQWSHNPIPVEKWEKILQPEHGDNKKLEVDLARLTPNQSPNLGLQSTLEGRESNRAVQKHPNESPAPLPSLLSEVAKHFTSPLAKGRIFKQLKAFPIVKS